MLQPKHPLTALVSSLVQGVFRAGHLSLIALGLFALSQVVHIPLAATRQVRTIDAMGGASDGLALAAPAPTPAEAPLRDWLTTAQTQVQLALNALAGISTAAEVAPAEVPVTVVPAAPVAPQIARLSDYLATRYRVSNDVVENLVLRAHEVGKEIGVDPMLIVAVMAVESSFNPLSESRVGAQGLMQVIPKYHMDKLGEDAGKLALFEPETNIRVGTLVLKEYIRRSGSVEIGLQTYAGALADEDMGYSRKVLGTREKLVQAARG